MPRRANTWWPERRGDISDRFLTKTFILEIKWMSGFGTEGLNVHSTENCWHLPTQQKSDIYTAWPLFFLKICFSTTLPIWKHHAGQEVGKKDLSHQSRCGKTVSLPSCSLLPRSPSQTLTQHLLTLSLHTVLTSEQVCFLNSQPHESKQAGEQWTDICKPTRKDEGHIYWALTVCQSFYQGHDLHFLV